VLYSGSWTPQQKQIIANFLQNVGNSSWYYQMMNKAPKENLLTLKSDRDLSKRIKKNIDDLKLKYDQSGESWIREFVETNTIRDYISIFLLGPDATIPYLSSTSYRKPAWYQDFCGSHTFGIDEIQQKSKTKEKRFIVVQYPTAATNLHCIPSKMKQSPNKDAGLDALINILAHELIETVSGYDIGNLCVYDFGTIQTASDGGSYTETMGAYKYFIQRNYNYKTQTCMNG